MAVKREAVRGEAERVRGKGVGVRGSGVGKGVQGLGGYRGKGRGAVGMMNGECGIVGVGRGRKVRREGQWATGYQG